MKELWVKGLYAKYYPGEKGTVILIHGLLSSHPEFFDYPEKINERGYATLLLDLEGHGRSRGKRGFESVSKNVENIKTWTEYLQRKDALKKPLILLGHSLGAATVIYALARNIGDAGVAIAPPSTIREELGIGERILLPIIYGLGRLWERITGKDFYISYRVNYRAIYRDAHIAEKAEKMNFLGNKLWIGSYNPLMSLDTVAQARKVRKPCLVIIPSEDGVVRPEHQRKVYESLSGEKELYIARGYGHSVMGEDRGDVIATILQFLEKQRNRLLRIQ